MKILKRLGLSVLILPILLLVGCTTWPRYDANGNYVGSDLTWDAGKIAGAGTGALLGGAAGLALGDPVGGVALGTAVGGLMPQLGPSEPIHIPGTGGSTQQNSYPYPAPRQNVVPPPVQYYQGGNYYGGGSQYQYQYQMPQYFSSPTCQSQYDDCMFRANETYRNKTAAAQQFLQSTGDQNTYSRLTQDIRSSYDQSVLEAKNNFAYCIQNMR